MAYPRSTRSSTPCHRARTIVCYVAVCLVFATALSLNNFLLLYIQQPIRGTVHFPNNGLPLDTQNGDHQSLSHHTVHESRKVLNVDERESPVRTLNLETASGQAQSLIVTPNELLQKLSIFIINTESKCDVKQVVGQLQHDYGDIPIYLLSSANADAVCHSASSSRGRGVHCINPPGECSAGCAYNHAVQTISDKGDTPYVIVWDIRYSYDDMHFLPFLSKKYVEQKADIVSPCVKGYCNATAGILLKSGSSGELTALPAVYPLRDLKYSEDICHRTEILPPIYLTTLDLLTKHPWEAQMDRGKHLDFLLTAKLNRLSAIVCTDIEVPFNGTCSQSKGMSSSLEEVWLETSNQVFKKWKITKVHNGLGKTCWPEEGSVSCLQRNWTELAAGSTLINHSQPVILDHENSHRAGWVNIRRRETGGQKLAYMATSPCMMRVKGHMDVEYDRHKKFPNKNMTLPVDIFHLDRACGLYQDYWNITSYGKLKRRHVYYVVAVSNDTEFMGRLLQLVNAQLDINYTSLVIVDMSRKGQDQFNISKYKHQVSSHYIHLGAPFSRSIGLKKGFEIAQAIAQENSHGDPILFAIDTSMVIPKDFTGRIWRSARCGVSTYAPICYKKVEDNGHWVQYGYGMIGVCASDYFKSGGWNPAWGYHWGAEDVDLIHRLQNDLPYTVRLKESHYKHSHTGENRIYSKLYYDQKNVYHKPLPITPTTVVVQEGALMDSLYQFAIRKMKYSVKLSLKIVYQTLLANDSGVLYDLRLRNAKNEEYYALIHSI